MLLACRVSTNYKEYTSKHNDSDVVIDVIYAVLDEADRMLDEGFIPTIRQILSACPPKRDASTGKDRRVILSTSLLFTVVL